eukprot:CAMPEP_0117063180 /NCGR_PEP_ID=MMETSP0472-20121206/44096_1 /TAXON_ID=693140 ORGANISM="Tiarina fusus, Strain LIS" /NCGR_SAMPLE_ID=MMETSP0472 /ASSEMBLY_ACC=CAM_ASM_000603 /LENGTH=37 /DNA_ID= /DNA_START= /DNA_END= /DNA_ORIENTATION=
MKLREGLFVSLAGASVELFAWVCCDLGKEGAHELKGT